MTLPFLFRSTFNQYCTYFLFLQPNLDVDVYLASKATILAIKGRSLQPHVIVSGGVVYSIIQGELHYVMPSLLEAIDACFKSTFVFQLQCNAAAISSWTFLFIKFTLLKMPN